MSAFHKMLVWVFVLSVSMSMSVCARGAEPQIHLSFDDGTVTNKGSFAVTGLEFHDEQGDAPVFIDTGLGDTKAITFDGTNWINTTTTTDALGIAGGAPKSVSALIKVDTTGNYSLWSVGTRSDGADFTIKVSGDTTMMAQLWAMDFNTSAPASLTQDWALATITYDGTNVSVYYNNQRTGSQAKTLITGNANIQAAYWNAPENSYRGSMADFRVYDTALTAEDLTALVRSYGGEYIDFVGQGTVGIDGYQWHSGCGNTMFSANTSEYNNVLSSYPVLAGLNQKTGDSGRDGAMGVLWGKTFTVLDDTKSISLDVGGGAYTKTTEETGGTNLTALRGKGGTILYDITQGKFLLDTWRCAETNGTTLNSTISLAGLKGHTLALAVFDLNNAGWGMTSLNNVRIPLGSVEFNTFDHAVAVTKAWNFDNAGDWEGWTEYDLAGNPVTTGTNFRFGSISTCRYSIGDNYITSSNSGWDAPTGLLRSEEFQITGDIIEFMINGGKGVDAAFELYAKQTDGGDFELVRTAQSEQFSGSNDFEYSFWNVSDLDGLTAYLQLRDSTSGSWGWIGIDNVQMIEFNPAPEPCTWALLLLGCAGLFFVRGRQRGKRCSTEIR